MKSVIFFAHPNFTASKLNKILLSEVEKYPEIVVRDLYKLYGNTTFNSHIDAKEDQAIMEKSDRIILQFPFRWYSTPALLKQWIDDTLAYDWAFGTANATKLAGKKLLIAITTGGPDTSYKPNGYNNYYVTEFITTFVQTAKLCKMEFAGVFLTQGASIITDAEIKSKAQDYIKFIKGE